MRLRSFTFLLAILSTAVFADTRNCRPDHFTQIRGYPVEIERSGDRLWIADGAGLTEVDVSDRLAPQIMWTTFEESPSLAVEVLAEDLVALLTEARLLLYDVSVPGSAPVLLSEVEAHGQSIHRLGSLLVVVGDHLTAYDWSSGELAQTAEVELEGDSARSAVVGELLLVSVPEVGTVVFDEGLGRRGRVHVVASSIVGREEIAYLGRGDAIFAADLSQPDDPDILDNLGAETGATQMALHENWLIATNGAGTVHVVDVSRADAMELVSSRAADIDVLTAAGGDLFSYGFSRDRFGTRFENGPYLVVRDPESPELEILGAVGESTGPLRDVATDGTTAWLADPPYLRAVDLQTGTERWRLRIDEPFDRIRFENDLLILYGATWVHLVEPGPDAGKLLGKWPTLGTPGGGVTFSGPWLIEANRASGFHVLDVSDPANIVQRGGLINDGRGQWMEVVGIPGAVYGIANTGVKVVALEGDPSAVEIADFLPFGKPVDVEIATVDGQPHLVVLDGSMLRVHHLRDPLHPVPTGVIEVGEAKKMSVAGEMVAVLGKDGLVTRVSLENPDDPVIIDKVAGMREGLSVAAADGVLAGADRWALWSIPIVLAEESAAPSLTVTEEGHLQRIGWDAPTLHETQIQIASDPLFSEIEQDVVIREEVFQVERSRRNRWIRARFRTGCTASAWSSVVPIDAVVLRGRAVSRP